MTEKLTLAAICLLCLCSVNAGEKARYDNYKVYSVEVKNTNQVNALVALKSSAEFVFWRDPGYAGMSPMIMVPPHKEPMFHDFMDAYGLSATITIDNVQKLVDEQYSHMGKSADSGVEWSSYHTLEEIYDWLDELAEKYSNVETVDGGDTYEGRKIKGIKITNGDNLPGAIFESGIHAREWIAPAATSWFINEALNSPKDSVWRQFNILYFPSVNPDGYQYTIDKDRMWRKNRSPHSLCRGVDLNRNWNCHWMEGGASSNPCAEDFAGPSAFSEVETKGLSDYLTSVCESYDIYVSFHSYSQLLMFPWGYTGTHAPNHDLWQRIGDAAAAALKAVHGTKFEVGNIHDTIYPASGSSIEWHYGAFNSTLSYTFELRDTGKYGFVLPPEQIIPTGEEIKAAVETLLTEYQKLPPNMRSHSKQNCARWVSAAPSCK